MVKNDFKLVAIRPLAGCSRKYSKILETGRIYQFYCDFDFSAYEKFGKIRWNNTVPDIYNLGLDDGPFVSVSAVVGRNGSGKSTLFELYYQFCFFISMKLGIVDLGVYSKVQLGLKEKIAHVNDCVEEMVGSFCVEIFFKRGDSLIRFGLDKNGRILYQKQKFGDGAVVFDDSCDKNVKSVDDIKELDACGSEKQLSSLFYSIAVNYSLYGLNTRENGMWLLPMFHKNDGYQTPLVVNPYRTEGVININSETQFAKYRLLANLLFKCRHINELSESGRLTGKLDVTRVVLKVNDEKFAYIGRVMSGLEDAKKNLSLISDPKEVNQFNKKKEYALTLMRDTNSVLKLAQLYEKYKVKSLKEKNIGEYDLYNDMELPKSHVFFKLKQVRNFLRLSESCDKYVGNLASDLYGQRSDSSKEYEYRLHDIIKLFGIKEDDSLIDVYCKLPPPIFDFDLILVSSGGDVGTSENIRFMNLSSGERHMIYAIQTIVYHIVNLQSIHYSDTENKQAHLVYDCVNVMLDEIELYFHPEYQRRFVSELLDALNNVDFHDGIKGINILINTHSPFILSDIPKQNCLFLDNKKGYAVSRDFREMHTYGANIYDMLRNSFFLNESTGEFSEQFIKSIVKKLNSKGRISKDEKRSLELGIRLIDEPIIRRKLAQMFDDRFKSDGDLELQLIDDNIRYLKQERERILGRR